MDRSDSFDSGQYRCVVRYEIRLRDYRSLENSQSTTERMRLTSTQEVIGMKSRNPGRSIRMSPGSLPRKGSDGPACRISPRASRTRPATISVRANDSTLELAIERSVAFSFQRLSQEIRAEERQSPGLTKRGDIMPRASASRACFVSARGSPARRRRAEATAVRGEWRAAPCQHERANESAARRAH